MKTNNKKAKNTTLFELFISFAKVGVMTFGGGYAMLPILQREVCDDKKWATEEEIMDYYAIGQCTPGIIAVNTATFIGNKTRGVLGGIIATLGLVFPSLVIITLIATVLTKFSELSFVQHAFAGIRVCVCVLIVNATLKLWKKAIVDKITLIMFLLIVVGSIFFDLSPVVYVFSAAVIGIIFQMLILKNTKEDK